MTAQDPLSWLAGWYGDRCDGTWEHSFGIRMETLDNPGWLVAIDLAGTRLEGQHFDPVSGNADAPDGDPSQRWHVCKVEGGQFKGAGGVHDLGTIIDVFRRWALRGAH